MAFDSAAHDLAQTDHAARVYTAQYRAERHGGRQSEYCKTLAVEAVNRLSSLRSLRSGAAWLLAGEMARVKRMDPELRRSFVTWARDARLAARMVK